MNPPTYNLLDEAMITFEHYIQQACIGFTRSLLYKVHSILRITNMTKDDKYILCLLPIQ